FTPAADRRGSRPPAWCYTRAPRASPLRLIALSQRHPRAAPDQGSPLEATATPRKRTRTAESPLAGEHRCGRKAPDTPPRPGPRAEVAPSGARAPRARRGDPRRRLVNPRCPGEKGLHPDVRGPDALQP